MSREGRSEGSPGGGALMCAGPGPSPVWSAALQCPRLANLKMIVAVFSHWLVVSRAALLREGLQLSSSARLF